jgi:hypothetical protein
MRGACSEARGSHIGASTMKKRLENNKMQRTKPGQTGASPLILVLYGPTKCRGDSCLAS